MDSKKLFSSNSSGVRLSFLLTEMMKSWWLITLTSGQNWADFSKISLCGLKSLIFCKQLAEVTTNNMSKNLYSISNSPEVIGWNVWPEVKKIRKRKSKNRFSKSLEKTVQRVLFWFFDIVSHDGARGSWSLISSDDVITGSCPDQCCFHEFRGF